MRRTARCMVIVGVLAAALAVGTLAGAASAAGYNAGQLAECAPSIVEGVAPSGECCTKLRAEQGCLCRLDPKYGRYVNNPNAGKTFASCGLAVPHCTQAACGHF